jgi:hypothetical protein
MLLTLEFFLEVPLLVKGLGVMRMSNIGAIVYMLLCLSAVKQHHFKALVVFLPIGGTAHTVYFGYLARTGQRIPIIPLVRYN